MLICEHTHDTKTLRVPYEVGCRLVDVCFIVLADLGVSCTDIRNATFTADEDPCALDKHASSMSAVNLYPYTCTMFILKYRYRG